MFQVEEVEECEEEDEDELDAELRTHLQPREWATARIVGGFGACLFAPHHLAQGLPWRLAEAC